MVSAQLCQDGVQLLGADADNAVEFGANVVALWRDKGLWGRVRGATMERVQRENGRELYTQALEAIIYPTKMTSSEVSREDW